MYRAPEDKPAFGEVFVGNRDDDAQLLLVFRSHGSVSAAFKKPSSLFSSNSVISFRCGSCLFSCKV